MPKANISSLSPIICPGYPYSNDAWTPKSVGKLRDALASQRGNIQKERATGIVIGAGGLPYTLGYMGVSQVVMLDRNKHVIRSIRNRIDTLQKPTVTNWDLWHKNVKPNIYSRINSWEFSREYRRARKSGLLYDFEKTRDEAAKIDFVDRNEDLVTGLPSLAQELRDEGREVSIINVTNVAKYLKKDNKSGLIIHPNKGREALIETMRDLPFAAGAIVIEAQRGFNVDVHLAENYMQR